MIARFLAAVVALSACAACAATPIQTPPSAAAHPIVIGHRGASGYRPEHTESSYRLAIAQGADFIEPDLVMTKDGVLVTRHENEIGRTTDVAVHPEFADRRVTRTIDGESFTGWFVEDFTLAELKTLRARERNPALRPESARHDGQEPVLTLEEVIAIAREEGEARGRAVGLYIELKNPGYHAQIGLPMERALVDALAAAGLNSRDAPIYIQSFWPQALIALRPITPVRLTFLINSVAPPESILRANGLSSWAEVYSPAGLQRISAFADAIGPETQLVLPRGPDARTLAPTSIIADAHAAGLAVHIWSISAENAELPADYRRGDPQAPGYDAQLGDATGLARRIFALGADGVFTDYPDLVVRGRDQ